MKSADPYEVLGISKNATEAEVRSRYRKLARRYHPDTNDGDATAEWMFKEVNEAHQEILDRRRHASEHGHEAAAPARRTEERPADSRPAEAREHAATGDGADAHRRRTRVPGSDRTRAGTDDARDHGMDGMGRSNDGDVPALVARPKDAHGTHPDGEYRCPPASRRSLE